MRKEKYNVIYVNGNEETFTGNSFIEAIARAMVFAFDNATDARVKYVTDEHGTTIKDIDCINYKYSK